ncbi:MAG: glycoside hydrolase family 32 protein [Micropruina sp.]|uniref:glycoside hydrolase family 32 protein n=1 Tax=Micropruina sp. TaxID=2737536 RepID=UPI0039E2C472
MTSALGLPPAEDAESLLGRIRHDPARPRFHLTAPTGWLNDPNGLCQRDGVHHLFYQYNPAGGFHHQIQWGHATSRDLVHWTDRPAALQPSEGPDADGCWSGVLVDDGGTPTLVYTGHAGDADLPCLATGSADLLSWTKDPGNPVIGERPASGMSGFRDHCVWREGDRWRMLIGAGLRGSGGFVALYDSPDLRSWEYRGPFLSGTAFDRAQDDPVWPGTMWECAELFRLDADRDQPLGDDRTGHDFLVFSAWHQGLTHHALYWSGSYRGDRFAPSGLHRLDLGGRYFYAPQSYRDEAGRRIMFGWLQDARSPALGVAAGWAGVMSLPRLVTERGDGTLQFAPAPEVESLRAGCLVDRSDSVGPDAMRRYPEVSGGQLDLEIEVILVPGAGIEVQLPGHDLGGGCVGAAVLRIERSRLDSLSVQLDRSTTAGDPGIDTSLRGGFAPVAADGAVGVRIVVDHSALEIFVNGVALTARVHPESTETSLGVRTAAASVPVALRAWRMTDAWPSDRP